MNELNQLEADALMAMEKHRLNEETYSFPLNGESLVVPLVSGDKKEEFFLDISRGRIDLLRGKYQERARQAVVLIRLDFGGPAHRNPDDNEIQCPHMHIYREGYGDKWAYPLPKGFSNVGDLNVTLDEFMNYCNITQPPSIVRGLF